MTTDQILEPSDALKDAIRLAENIKIAHELVEEKSPKGNKKLNYLHRNLSQEIDSILKALNSATNSPNNAPNYEDVDFEIVVEEAEESKQEKII